MVVSLDKVIYLCILGVTGSLLLTPGLIVGKTAIRIDDILLLLAIVLLFINFKNIRLNCSSSYLLALMILSVVSSLMGMFGGYHDSFPFSKYYIQAKGLLIFVLYYSVKEYDFRLFYRVLLYSALILVVFSFVERFDALSLNSILYKFVSPDKYYLLLDVSTMHRNIGFLGNPNEYAFLLLLLSVWIMFLSYSERYIFVLLFGLYVSIWFTGSRIVIIASTILLMYFLLKNKNILLIFLSAAAAVVIIYKGIADFDRFLAISDYETNMGIVNRYNSIVDSLDIIADNLLLGIGPVSKLEGVSLDSGHVLMVRNYGAIGFVLFLLYLFGVGVKGRNKRSKIYVLAFISLIYMVTANIITSSVLFPLLILVYVTILRVGDRKAVPKCSQNHVFS